MEGGFTNFDRFVYLPLGANEGMLRVWQAAMLALFLRKKLIDQARADMLTSWRHSGFSIESDTRLYTKADREALGQYVVRGATCAEKIHFDPDTDTVTWTASPKGFYKGRIETFKGFEIVDQLVAHLPPRRVQLVRRYGAYSGKVRNQWQQRSGIYHLAPEAWKQAHQLRMQSTPEAKPAAVDPTRAAGSRAAVRQLPRSSRLSAGPGLSIARPDQAAGTDNNAVLKKLRIALALRDEQLLAIFAAGGTAVRRHELSALFRRRGQGSLPAGSAGQ